LLKATPVEREVSAAELSVAAQIGRNVISGFLAILTNPTNSHFVIGTYVDPLTALFVLIGVSYLLVTFGRQRTMTAWLIGSLLLLVAISGIQQYSRIATTRMFSVVGIFAIYAGVGSTTLLHFLLPNKRWLHYGAILLFLAAITAINQYHITHVTLPNSEKPNIPLIVQQFQESATDDGYGMPVFVIEQDPANSLLKLVLQAYQIRRERIMLLTAEEALQIPYLCEAGQSEAMLIMPVTTVQSAELRNRVASCWPGYQETPLYNRVTEITLYRFTSAAAQAALQLAPEERSRTTAPQPALTMRGAQSVAVAPDGALYVLSAAVQKVLRYAPNGQATTVFSIQQRNPTALVVNQKGELIVAGGQEKVVWYDTKGKVIQKSSAVKELHRPFGLVVIDDNELLVSDLERRQLVHLSAGGHLLQTITIPEIGWPSALALTPNRQSIWIYDAQYGMITEVALSTYTVLRQISAHQIGAEENVALAVLPNQNLLQTVPDQRRLLEVSPTGEIVRAWSGFDQPTALAVSADTQIFVLERKLEEVHRLPALYTTGFDLADSTTAGRQQRSDTTTTGVSPLSPLPTPSTK
jgi:sugar lactone lactonase YvrE